MQPKLRASLLTAALLLLVQGADGLHSAWGREASSSPTPVQGENDDVRQEVERLRDQRTRQAARLRLLELPAPDVVRELGRALATRSFESNRDATAIAYELLFVTVSDPPNSQRLGTLSDGQPLALFIEGTKHPTEYIQHVSARALGGALPHQRALVVAPLRNLALSDAWIAAVEAIESLGKLGPEASPALEPLLMLLRNPDARLRERWAAYVDGTSLVRGLTLDDLERRIRSAAALARTRIVSPAVDLKLYAELDLVGIECAATALTSEFQLRFCPFDDTSPPPAPAAEHDAVSTTLAQMFRLPTLPLRVRKEILRALAVQLYFPQLSERLRGLSREVLDFALKSDEEELRRFAEAIDADLRERAR